MSAPDFSRKLVGFRTFEARRGGLEAVGIGSYHWWPGVNKARCLKHGTTHEAPANDCQCGLYAFHDIPEDWTRASLTGRTVGAAILAWGRVELHHNGFRAEYAEVGLLAYDRMAGPKVIGRIKRRAKDFDVPAVDVFDLPDALVMLDGERVPDRILPEKPASKESAVGFLSGGYTFPHFSFNFDWGAQKIEAGPESDLVELPAIKDRLSALGVRLPDGYRGENGLWTP